jgi:hypothetical protein
VVIGTGLGWLVKNYSITSSVDICCIKLWGTDRMEQPSAGGRGLDHPSQCAGGSAVRADIELEPSHCDLISICLVLESSLSFGLFALDIGGVEGLVPPQLTA